MLDTPNQTESETIFCRTKSEIRTHIIQGRWTHRSLSSHGRRCNLVIYWSLLLSLDLTATSTRDLGGGIYHKTGATDN